MLSGSAQTRRKPSDLAPSLPGRLRAMARRAVHNTRTLIRPLAKLAMILLPLKPHLSSARGKALS
jgi:hypothetical protein